jgi:predicted nucleotidyltransferase
MCKMKYSDFIKDSRIRLLVSLGLETEDFAIYGSGLLWVHNLRPVSDLDVIVRGEAWERIKQIGSLSSATLNGAPTVRLLGGALEFTNGWIAGESDVDKLIDEAEKIYGIPFVRLSYVLSYKRNLKREKDLADIEAIEEHFNKETYCTHAS